jgi:iron complex outermembrane receptor protein
MHATLGAHAESVNDGVASQFRIDVPTGPFAWTVEGSGRRAGDVVTPAGTLDNSQLDTWMASGGVSWIAGRGYLGAGVNRYESNYGVPGGFLGGHPFGADIELRRTQLETRGALTLRKSGPTQLEGQFIYTRYFHRELESHGVCGVSFGLLTYDASTRLRFDAGRWGAGAVGVAGEYRDYANGCLSFIPPTTEGTLSAFGLDRARVGPIELQAAARVDARSVTPASAVRNKAGLVRQRDFAGGSGSLAARLPLGKSAGVTVTTSLAFRPPSLEELFSEGPHLAAFAYEIGNADLEAEQGRGVELAFEWNRPRVGLQARGFFNSIDGFIQAFDTGQVEYGPGEDGFLARYQYSGKDSRMAGGELELLWTLRSELQLHASAGYVAGEVVETGVPLPRIPPLNGHLALEWRRGVWGAQISTTGASAQNRVGEFEKPTAGYLTLGGAIEWQHAAARRLHSLVLRGQNLTNAEYRNHLSRVKSIMPEPGRSVALLYRLSFF